MPRAFDLNNIDDIGLNPDNKKGRYFVKNNNLYILTTRVNERLLLVNIIEKKGVNAAFEFGDSDVSDKEYLNLDKDGNVVLKIWIWCQNSSAGCYYSAFYGIVDADWIFRETSSDYNSNSGTCAVLSTLNMEYCSKGNSWDSWVHEKFVKNFFLTHRIHFAYLYDEIIYKGTEWEVLKGKVYVCDYGKLLDGASVYHLFNVENDWFGKHSKVFYINYLKENWVIHRDLDNDIDTVLEFDEKRYNNLINLEKTGRERREKERRELERERIDHALQVELTIQKNIYSKYSYFMRRDYKLRKYINYAELLKKQSDLVQEQQEKFKFNNILNLHRQQMIALKLLRDEQKACTIEYYKFVFLANHINSNRMTIVDKILGSFMIVWATIICMFGTVPFLHRVYIFIKNKKKLF